MPMLEGLDEVRVGRTKRNKGSASSWQEAGEKTKAAKKFKACGSTSRPEKEEGSRRR
jgi:hypothetical protein